jgi:hypothetical protein
MVVGGEGRGIERDSNAKEGHVVLSRVTFEAGSIDVNVLHWPTKELLGVGWASALGTTVSSFLWAFF